MKKYNFFFLILVAILQNSCQKETITTDIDPSFEQFLISEKIDSDGIVNGKISKKDLLEVEILEIGPILETENCRLKSLAGIEKMEALGLLILHNQIISQIDLTKIKELKSLSLYNVSWGNNFSLKFAQDNLLLGLSLHNFKEIKIDLNQFNNLTHLELSNCEIPQIDLTKKLQMTNLRIQYNTKPITVYINRSQTWKMQMQIGSNVTVKII